MLEMAKVEFDYFREKLGVLEIEGPFQGEVMSLEAIVTSRSDVRAEPLCHGERIWFLPC